MDNHPHALDVDATYMQFTSESSLDFGLAIVHADMDCVADNTISDAFAEQLRIRGLLR
jgi:hypothetical protein